MDWCFILHGCVILMNLFIFSDGCQIQPMEKSNVQCDTCLEEQYSVEVCSQATGRNHRLNNFTVLSSNAQVLSRDFINNRTALKLDISREYSEYRRGYLFIFIMDDDDRLLCKSTLFPRCRAQLASLALSVNGRSSTGPEIHQLLDVRAVTEDWISEITTSGCNSSYLKISFDVKSRDVKWYAVELWDSKNNLIKADKTEKNYIVFRNVTKGLYYAVVCIFSLKNQVLAYSQM
ncbi:uncharacterized protein LOC134252073 [Saccostrea cucullata]|uniref:uncharacterized protein LOC134252073 n=1 Tax=Saccostrea cuccullata TaxID=36930 RepID=UPI002ED1EC41